MSIARVPEFVVGHVVRTTNAAESDESNALIPGLWQRTLADESLLSVRGRIGEELFAVYFDYETDHTGAYSQLVGIGVASIDDVPAGIACVRVGAAERVSFHAAGPMPAALMQTWAGIWSDSEDGSLRRAFTTDVEVHNADGSADILVAVR